MTLKMQETAMAEADIAKTQPKGFNSSKSVCRAKFDELKKENRPAFVGYLPYGFPDPEKSIMMFETLVRNGADIVEIGLPYSDPVMDGTIIQNACSAALANGEKISGVFRAVETVAKEGAVPLVMSYWNILFHYGIERFSRDFVNAGGAGIVTPDLIPDEAGEWMEASDKYGLDRIFLVSQDSTDERLKIVSRASRGFVYAASRMGVTGERTTLSETARALVERSRNAGSENVCVGIGISTPEQAKQAGLYADGVIVGSALVHACGEGGEKQLAQVANGLSQAVRAAR